MSRGFGALAGPRLRRGWCGGSRGEKAECGGAEIPARAGLIFDSRGWDAVSAAGPSKRHLQHCPASAARLLQDLEEGAHRACGRMAYVA